MLYNNNINRIVIDQIGDILYVNQYKILGLIATGTFCKVYKVQANMGSNLRTAAMVTSKHVNQVKNKIEIQSILKNMPNIPYVYEQFINPTIVYDETNTDQQELYEQLKYGVMFQQFVPHHPLTEQTFDNLPLEEHINRRIYLFLQLVQTVIKIHEYGVYHLDLKPENIIISENDYYIVDFGSAQHVEYSNDYLIMDTCIPQDQKATVVYNITPSYSSLKYDQSNGLLLCDKYDAYSLGCIFYYLMVNEHLQKPLSQQYYKCKQICDEYGYLILDLILGLTHEDPVLRYSLKECLHHPVFYQFISLGNKDFYSKKIRKEIEDFLKDKKNRFIFFAMPMATQFKLIYQFRLNYIVSLRKQMYHNVKQSQLFKQRSKSVQKPKLKKKNHSYDDIDMKYYKDFINYQEYDYPCQTVDEQSIFSSSCNGSDNIIQWENKEKKRNIKVNKIIQSYKRYFQLFFWSTKFFVMFSQFKNESDNCIFSLQQPDLYLKQIQNGQFLSIYSFKMHLPKPNSQEQTQLPIDMTLLDSFVQDMSDNFSCEVSDVVIA